jgi:hypothetical protein
MPGIRCTRFVSVIAACLCCAVMGGCGGQGAMTGHSMGSGPRVGPGGGPPPIDEDVLAAIHGPSVDEIMSRLSLGDDQVSRVRSILEAAEEERSEIIPDPSKQGQQLSGTAGAGDVLVRCADLDERAAGMLQPILSEQQLAAFVSMMTQAQKAREDALSELVKQRRPPEGGPSGGRPGGFGGGGFPSG